MKGRPAVNMTREILYSKQNMIKCKNKIWRLGEMNENRKTRVLTGTNVWVRGAIIAIVLVCIAAITGCGGAAPVNMDFYIPDLDQTQYNDPFYQEGWDNLKQGKPDRAIKNFKQSRAVEEKLYLGFGYAYLARNKIQLARRNFEKCLAVNPGNLRARFGLAAMFELSAEREKAFRIYSRLRASHPGNAWVKVRYDYIKTTETENYLKKAEQYKIEKQSGAYIDALEGASRYSPEIVEIKVEIADFFVSQEQYEKAARQYEGILEKLPNHQEILLKLAAVYEKMSKFDSAVVIYKKMQELKPGDLEISNKINELKAKFYELKLPVKFKNIFFKEELSREDLAALIGYYFETYLETPPPVIITDIGGSFAKEYIIKVCTLRIMRLRPDHSFERFTTVNRAVFAVVIDGLLKYLEKYKTGAYSLQFTPLDEVTEPADISPLHKDYEIIKFLVNSGIIKLDAGSNFNPTRSISPSEALVAIRKILNSIRSAIDIGNR
jgi:tetratricopeptide (TPR) repeat protein